MGKAISMILMMAAIAALGWVVQSDASTVYLAFNRHRVVEPEPVHSEPAVNPSALVSPVPDPPAPIPPADKYGEVQFEPVEYYTRPEERVRIKSAGAKALEVVHSQCFFDFISKRNMIMTNGRSSAEVAAHLQSLSGTVPVKFYLAFNSAIAYRQPPEIEINLNRKFLSASSSNCEMGSVLGHEIWGHALGGYDHSYRWNPQRPFSVPYSINAAFDACCQE